MQECRYYKYSYWLHWPVRLSYSIKNKWSICAQTIKLWLCNNTHNTPEDTLQTIMLLFILTVVFWVPLALHHTALFSFILSNFPTDTEQLSKELVSTVITHCSYFLNLTKGKECKQYLVVLCLMSWWGDKTPHLHTCPTQDSKSVFVFMACISVSSFSAASASKVCIVS